MAEFVLHTTTTQAGWNSFDDLIRAAPIGYTGGTALRDMIILRPFDGAVDIYVRAATTKPAATDSATIGKGLLAAGGQYSNENVQSTNFFIYTASVTPIVLQANGKLS